MALLAAEMLARLRLDKRQYDKGMIEARKEGGRFSGAMSKAGAVAKTALIAGAAVGAAAVVSGLTKATSAAIKFERQMHNVNSLLQLNGQEARALNRDLLEFTAGSSQTITKVADAYYDIASGIADTSKHMAVLSAVERTSTAGFADLKSTTAAVVGIMNAYNLKADQAASVGDILTISVRNGVLTMDQLASALPKVTGLAAATGIEFSDLAGSLAGITKAGVSADIASTQLQALMTAMIKPSEKLQATIEKLGYKSGEALVSEKGLVGAIKSLKDAAGDDFKLIFNNVRALNGALNLTAPAASEAHAAIQDYAGAVDAAIAASGNAHALDEMRAKLSVISVMIGSTLTPIVLGFVQNGLNPMLDGIVRMGKVLGLIGNEVEASVEQTSHSIETGMAKSTEAIKYVVKEGDNLTAIAKANNLSLDELLGLNEGLDPSKYIHAGQEIIVAIKEINKAVAGAGSGGTLSAGFEQFDSAGPDTFIDKLKSVAGISWSALTAVYTDVLKPLASNTWDNLQRVYNEVFVPVASLTWKGMKALWDIVQPLASLSWDAFLNVFNTVLLPLQNAAFDGFITLFKEGLSPLAGLYWKGVKSLWSILEPMATATYDSLTTVLEKLANFDGIDFGGTLSKARDFLIGFVETNLGIDLVAVKDQVKSSVEEFVAGIEVPSLEQISVTLTGIRERITSKLSSVIEKISLPELPAIDFDLQAIRDGAAERLTSLLSAINLLELPAIDFDLGSVRDKASAKLSTLLSSIGLPELPAIDFNLTGIRDSAAEKLSNLLSAIRSPELPAIEFNLTSIRDGAAEKLSTLLSSINLPDLSAIDFDLADIRNRASEKLSTLLSSINLPDLSAIDFDLADIRNRASEKLSTLLSSINLPDLSAIDFDLADIRNRASEKLSTLLSSINLPDLSAIDFDLADIRNRASEKLSTLLSSINLPDLSAIDFDLADIRNRASEKLSTLLSSINLPDLSAIDFDLADIRNRASEKLSTLLSSINLPDLSAIDFDLADIRNRASEKLSTLLSSINLPDLSAIDFDLADIRNRASEKLSTLLSAISLPELQTLSFDLTGIRNSAAEKLANLLDKISPPDLPSISFDLMGIRDSTQAKLSSLVSGITVPDLPSISINLDEIGTALQSAISAGLGAAKDTANALSLAIPEDGIQIDAQAVADTAIKAIGLLIGGPVGFIATLIVKVADDVVKQATDMSLSEHVTSAANSISSAVGIDLDAVGTWIRERISEMFAFLSGGNDAPTPPPAGVSVESQLSSVLNDVGSRVSSAISNIKSKVEGVDITSGESVGALVLDVFGDMTVKFSGFSDWVKGKIDEIDFTTIGANVGAWLGNAINGIGTWISDALSAIFNPVEGVDITSGESVGALVLDVLGDMIGKFSGFSDWVKGKIDEIDFTTIGANVGAWLGNAINGIGTWISDALSAIFNPTEDAVAPGAGAGAGSSETLDYSDLVSQFTTNVLNWIATSIGGIINLVGGFIGGLFGGGEDSTSSLSVDTGTHKSSITSIVESLLQGVVGLLKGLVDGVLNTDFAQDIMAWISDLTSPITESFQATFDSMGKQIKSLMNFDNILNSENLGELASNAHEKVKEVVNLLLTSITAIPRSMLDLFLETEWGQDIATWLGDIIDTGKQTITNAVQGVIEGIKAAARKIIPDEIKILGATVVSGLHESLGIKASVEQREFGGPVSAGELYQVNERGTEYFRPNVSGEVIPLSNVRDQQQPTNQFTINVYANDEQGGQAAADALEPRLLQLVRAV